ncbi:MAG: two-component regulator propeller domain-containing protein [Pseudomonadota bacterium]
MKNACKRLPLSGYFSHKIVMVIALLLCSVLFSAMPVVASVPEQISFQNILENEDIAMGEGRVLFQDSEGFMWLGGANALIRYDGYEFRQFYLNASGDKNTEKEPVKFVQHIFEDSHKTIWIGTRTGILQFDSNKEKLIQIRNDDSQEIQISTSDVMDIIELPSGEILACSMSGLIIIDPHSLKYSVIVPDNTKQNWLKSRRLFSAYLDGKDIWLGTEEGLQKVDWQTKIFTLYKPNAENPDSVPDNRVRDIVAGGEGKFWLATANGVVHYDPVTRDAKRYINIPNDRFSLSGNDVWGLLTDSKGVLWIASDGGGLSLFDKDKNRFANHQYEAGRAGSINSNQVRTVFEDKNGDIWVGNYPSGINFFDRSSASIMSYARDISNPNSLSHSTVLSAQEDKDGNLWLGTDGGGLNFFNRETGEFTHFKHDPNDPSSINGDAVLTTYIDSTGLIWVGVWGGGFASFDPVEKKFTRYPFDLQRKATARVSTSSKLNSAPVWSIREDKNHELWITTHSGGVSKYNRATKIFTHYTYIDNDPDSLSNDLAWNTFEDSKGNIWVGTSSGLNLLNREQGSFTRFMRDAKDPTSLSNQSALVIFEDTKHRLWIGTDAGLNLFNYDSKSFTAFTKKNGFIDDTIRNIVEDAQGNLWVSTNNGFASFNPETKKIKNYNRISGRLVGGFATHSGIVSSRGEIIFGGTDGLRIFKPTELTENKQVPPVVLTDFKIFSDSVVVGGADGILTESINHTESLQLDYTKSMFVFSFAALNFRDTAKNRYAYKLEGFDKDWLDVGNQRLAKYTNINAGKYVFKVKGSNNDGIWNETGKSVTIIQLPPPWKTWWAYTLYILAVLSLLSWLAFIQRRKQQRIEEQNKLLEIKVSERTAEVREKSKDIEAMLGNIPQGLFTVQADGTIHPEYSQFLEVIFATQNIAGRNVGEFLFAGAAIGSDALSSAQAAIFAIIGEDQMNFDFNQFLLPTEYEINIDHKHKSLSLDWNPIVAEDVVNKLMVSVRDVTQLRQMENAAREQKRQLDIVSQLLNLSAEKYLAFEESTTRYVQVNRIAIQSCSYKDKAVVALLFRNMHTVKGNCRTFGFTYLSDTVHEVETIYSSLSVSEDDSWEPLVLLNDLVLVEKVLAEYAHVYRAVLGRSNSTGSERRGGFWITNEIIKKIRNHVVNRTVDEFDNYVGRLNASTLEQNLADIIASLASIAAQLGKRAPVVKIIVNKIFIKDSAQELMRDVFAHILRNCVDHGLESSEERTDAGKSETGTIVIKPRLNQKTLTISVQDDGRGLNIDSLFKKGRQLGKWNEHDTPAIADIAALIFASGVSTKDVVSDISGRGVGLDAVKQFLEKQGGGVTLVLSGEPKADSAFLPASSPAFVPFSLIVDLPAHLFFEAEISNAE